MEFTKEEMKKSVDNSIENAKREVREAEELRKNHELDDELSLMLRTNLQRLTLKYSGDMPSYKPVKKQVAKKRKATNDDNPPYTTAIAGCLLAVLALNGYIMFEAHRQNLIPTPDSGTTSSVVYQIPGYQVTEEDEKLNETYLAYVKWLEETNEQNRDFNYFYENVWQENNNSRRS